MEKTNQIIFSVSDFLAVANQTLEYAYSNVAIEGEVSSFKINQNKFVFFDIKDKSGSVGCFMSIWQLRMPIEDGMKVIITGQPKITAWGKFSITIKTIRPSGEGSIKKSFELLKLKLEKEGLFAFERKRILPKIPKHIGVISSTGAAGYADFIKIINDRWGGVKIDVAHVQVQGEVAPDQIIGAIQHFNQQEILPEVLVIIRGGGSADDLSAFNDEKLVRAVAASRIPILSGIGHETDESLVDLVADVRASTPSNAAQIIVPDRQEMVKIVRSQVIGLLPRMLQIIAQQRQMIAISLSGAFSVVERSLENQTQSLLSLRKLLSELDPNMVLKRGYAIIRGAQSVGEVIEIETSENIMKAEVKNVDKK